MKHIAHILLLSLITIQSAFAAWPPANAQFPTGPSYSVGVVGQFPVCTTDATGLECVKRLASFYAPLHISIVPAWSVGNGTPTFTRPSTATLLDYDGNLKTVLSGEARFSKTRRVRNLLTYTESFSNAAWDKLTSGTGVGGLTVTDNYGMAPDGTMTATRVQMNIGAGTTASDYIILRQLLSANNIVDSVWVKLNSGSPAVVRLFDQLQPTITSSWTPYFTPINVLTSDVRVAELEGDLGTAKSIDMLIWHPLAEDATNQTNINRSEYVSNNVLSAPYYGAGVNGVQYFSTTKPFLQLTAYGDSLTAGTGSSGPSGTYPAQLSTSENLSPTYNHGVGGDTSTQILTRMLADSTVQKETVLIWAGNNNYFYPDTVKADIASMVSYIGHQNYLVVSIINSDTTNEYKGQPGYNTIIQLNADLAAIYGDKFVDVRTPLVASYNPNNSQDVIDHGHDVPPSSLRYDSIHLLDAGYAIVADTIKQRLNALYAGNAPLPTASSGYLSEPPATNYFLNSGAPATQTSQSLNAGGYTMSITGSGSVAVTAGTATISSGCTAYASTPCVFNITGAGTVVQTVSGVVSTAQLENNPFPTSYVPTFASAQTRNGDILSYPTSGNLSSTAWTMVFSYTPVQNTSSATSYLLSSYVDANNATQVIFTSNTVICRERIAGVNHDVTEALVAVPNTKYIIGCSGGSAGQTIYVNGVKGTSNSNTLPAQFAPSIEIGDGVGQPDAEITDWYAWRAQYSDATMQTLTTPN